MAIDKKYLQDLLDNEGFDSAIKRAKLFAAKGQNRNVHDIVSISHISQTSSDVEMLELLVHSIRYRVEFSGENSVEVEVEVKAYTLKGGDIG